MNFDGSSILEHLNDIDGTAIELIPSENKVYITAYGVADTPITENGLYLCKTDGTALSKIGISVQKQPGESQLTIKGKTILGI